MKQINSIISSLFLGAIWIYQKGISPFTPSTCRYTPTCSNYSKTAISRFGPWKGAYLALIRIASCHPWGGSGYDPVPKQ